MFGDIEFGLALVDRHSERARFSDRAIVMGRREDDPIDARRRRVEVEREAGPVRGRCEADFAVRRARVGEKDDVAIVADLLGSIETASRNVATGEAKGTGDLTTAPPADTGTASFPPF